MNLLQDVRFGFRFLRKSPGFTAVIVLVLALGIGANTTVFTLVNAVLFKGLPFTHPEEIMHLSCNNLPKGREHLGVSYPDYRDWRAQTKSFKDLAAFDMKHFNVSDNAAMPQRFFGARVSSNTFALVGERPILGRDFLPADDQPGAPSVCIIGYGMWKTRYGGDPSIIGRTIRLNEVPALIAGVMPEGFRFPLNQDIWLPLAPTGIYEKRDSRELIAFGRLRDDVTLASARAGMDTLAARLEKEYPASNQGVRAVVKPYNDAFNGGQVRILFLALMGAVAFVLLIACANVANLLLSRSLARGREVSIRAALGASRWRVLCQLLVESILLGLIGGVAGLAISFWGVRMFDLVVASVDKPYWIKFTMDYRLFAYFAAISLLTGVLFGLAPALHSAKVDINEALKEGARGSGGSSRMKFFSGALVVGELALAVVLLSGAGLMPRSFLNIYTLDLGVRKDNLLTMRYILAEAKYPNAVARLRFNERLLDGIRATPGVEAAAVASNLPMEGSFGWRYEVEGDATLPREKLKSASGVIVTPEYFRASGVRVLRGREFTQLDGLAGSEAAIGNERFAREHWRGGDALGKRLRLVKDDGQKPWLTVVGIVPQIRHNDPSAVETDALIYVPLRQDTASGVAVIARTKVPPSSLAAAFRKQVQKIDENQPVSDLRTLGERLAEQRWPYRVFGTLFAIFAFIALVLASVGIYAVMSYSVSQRTQEIGVRMALGATRGNVLRLIFAVGLRQLAIGLTLGLAASFAVTRVLKGLLVQITPTDPLTFVTISVLLCAIAALACWIPARRSMRIDPMIALRYE
jgi:putative ABC transport system permease protein